MQENCLTGKRNARILNIQYQHVKTGWLLFILLLIWALLPCMAVWAEEEDSTSTASLQQSIDALDFSSFETFKTSIDQEIGDYFEGKTVKDWVLSFIKGEWDFNLRTALESIPRFLFKEIMVNFDLLGQLLILAVVAALLVNLQGAFSTNVSRIAYMACYLAMAAIAVGSFKVVLGIGQETVDNMTTFMMAMLPQMLVLTAGLGNINASVMLFPVLMTTATALAAAIKNIVFPLIILSAVVSMVNHLSESIKVQRLGKFFTQMAQLSLGFLLTLFVGIVTLRALYASILDKVALRTTRFITDNAIPLVGKMFSDTVEVAAGYVVMLKQALGVLGVLIILGIILVPLLKIIALALIYKVSAALAEPLGDPRTAAVLESMSAHLFMMLAAVTAVALMFFIMIAIIAGMSNGLSMLP